MARSYMPTTINGHNMYDIASLLQKACRRGEIERAGYAAHELMYSYEKMLWKRLLVISAEDSWGVLTKEILHLRDKGFSGAKRGEERDFQKMSEYLGKAVTLLCNAKKSRDACYYACNFVLSDNNGKDIIPSETCVNSFKSELGGQICMIGEPEEKYIYAYRLYNGIMTFDMEDTGYCVIKLREIEPSMIWRVIRKCSEEVAPKILNQEVEALIRTEPLCNIKGSKAENDPIYISKAILNIMYLRCGSYDSIYSVDGFRGEGFYEWEGKEYIDITKCKLDGGELPGYVYDVHTIKGKAMGKTDWDMNLDENDALHPFQKAFFEDGSWELRYDYKNRVHICTEIEYQKSLEYRKTHISNPSSRMIKTIQI